MNIRTVLAGLLLAAALPAMAQAPAPSCDTPQYRQFDFWVGHFEVRTADGKLAGHNRIEAVLDGCALAEHWTGAGGGHGRSINFFDRQDGRWHQVWVDDKGRPLYLSGTFEDGAMVLSRESRLADGGMALQRITWTALEDGRIRQRWQSSSDGGETWTEVFDGYYRQIE